MADPDSRNAGPEDASAGEGDGGSSGGEPPAEQSAEEQSVEEQSVEEQSTEDLRAAVEEKYDFENFGPSDMAEMSREEWEAAFDPETWITGEELLDRVEADLKQRVLDRDVFARVERFDDVVVAYTADEYAAVYADGTVEGVGTVRRDVEPTVALCSMDEYDVPEPPGGEVLPEPREIPESSDTLGNTLLQVLGGVQVLAGLALLLASGLYFTGILSQPRTTGGSVNVVVMIVAGLGFLLVGLFLFVVVANARLSDRFRSEEYRDRLRGVGLADGERPAFLAEVDGVDLPASAFRSGGSEAALADDDQGGETGQADGSPGRPE